ncbi:hypothetical protein FOMPIDRAFT_1019707 [Fomitopsis schrenkii]|uniref:Uncharacterized protein n=1 Tax=Fomitopsis schrenkii TaxID=2126942 RepID=S8EZF7_FOMSC|nr:hypothetical protein FOMPIDRAFT_1019707 [Fomitopsis schrenkii]
MPPAEDAARQTKYKLAATFCIDADDFEAVPRGQLKQTYAARKERLFAAYKLPTPRVTRIQAFFGVDTPPQLTCEWIDSQEHALEVCHSGAMDDRGSMHSLQRYAEQATREVIERLAQTERTMIEKNYRLCVLCGL